MSMTQVTLRLPKGSLQRIKNQATKEGLTVTDYILSNTDPDYSSEDNILELSDILKRIDLVKKDKPFSLKSLYEKNEWESFSIGSRISTGRLFYQSYDKGLYDLKDKIEFIGKNSANLTEYKKIRNDWIN